MAEERGRHPKTSWVDVKRIRNCQKQQMSESVGFETGVRQELG